IASPKCHAVAYSADGKRLATGLNSKDVMIWDADAGQVITTLKPYRGELGSLSLTADGNCLAASYDNPTVTLKQCSADGNRTARLITPSNRQMPGALTFSPDGKRLATPGIVVQVWDFATGQEVFALKGHTALSNNQAFSPDGQRLATA